MQNNRLKLTKEWIIKAQNDLNAAKILYREKGPTDALCFHCHQGVEKFLKGFLVFQNIHFEKIHYLWKLAELCATKDKKFFKFEDELKTLDAYYIESRYPSEAQVYSREECKKVLEVAEKLTGFIINKII